MCKRGRPVFNGYKCQAHKQLGSNCPFSLSEWVWYEKGVKDAGDPLSLLELENLP